MNQIIWTPTSANRKTGSMITAWVGRTAEETKASCEGCPLKDKSCYAWKGSVKLGLNSTQKHAKTLETAIDTCTRDNKYARISAIGDIGGYGINPQEVKDSLNTLLLHKIRILGYTHFWEREENQWLKEFVRASCDNREKSEKARQLGWKSVYISEYTDKQLELIKPEKHEIVCLYYNKNNPKQCRDCGLCEVKHGKTVIFPRLHGGARQ